MFSFLVAASYQRHNLTWLNDYVLVGKVAKKSEAWLLILTRLGGWRGLASNQARLI